VRGGDLSLAENFYSPKVPDTKYLFEKEVPDTKYLFEKEPACNGKSSGPLRFRYN